MLRCAQYDAIRQPRILRHSRMTGNRADLEPALQVCLPVLFFFQLFRDV